MFIEVLPMALIYTFVYCLTCLGLIHAVFGLVVRDNVSELKQKKFSLEKTLESTKQSEKFCQGIKSLMRQLEREMDIKYPESDTTPRSKIARSLLTMMRAIETNPEEGHKERLDIHLNYVSFLRLDVTDDSDDSKGDNTPDPEDHVNKTNLKRRKLTITTSVTGDKSSD